MSKKGKRKAQSEIFETNVQKPSDPSFRRFESIVSLGLGALVVVIAIVLLFNYVNKRNNNISVPGISTDNTQAENSTGKDSTNSGSVVSANLPTTHTVAKGESLWKIAEKYYQSGYNWVTIVKENKLTNANAIEVGQKLSIPKAEKIVPPGQTVATEPAIKENEYTVVKGDDLWNISVRAYGDGYQWPKIAQANKLGNPNIIHPGNVLKIPR